MKVYFAGSIRAGRHDQPIYDDFIAYMKSMGHEVLAEHFGYKTIAESGANLPDASIHDRDIGWLESADALVAEVSTPSLGVGYEISYALHVLNKPVMVLFNGLSQNRNMSAMIAGAPKITICNYDRTSEGTEKAKQQIALFLNFA